MINELIREIAVNGLSDQMSGFFSVISFVPVVFLCVHLGRKLKIGIIRPFVLMVLLYIANFGLMLFLAWAEMGFRNFGAQNGIRSFVYTPLLCFLFAKILRMKWKNANVIWGLCLPFSHAVAHLGCVFVGCCEGYPWPWGIFNVLYGEYLFPIQIVESVAAFGVGVYLIWRTRKRGYIIDGKEYPIMLILFGSTRFLCEFFRANNKIWLGCSSLSFHALFMCLVGTIWLLVIGCINRKV